MACRYDKPVRIGVNWGSLDQELLTQLMDENARPATPAHGRRGAARGDGAVRASRRPSGPRSWGCRPNRILISAKVSDVQELIAVYRDLAARCAYALHLGLTEAGMGSKGIVASSAALGILLQEGIGDTIRISLTPEPGGDRTLEVKVAQELLQTMGFRAFLPVVSACPGCGRTTSTVFQELAQDIQGYIGREDADVEAATIPAWRRMKVAVMGCIVNGPGEIKHADIGISLPGTGEQPSAPVFIDGEKAMTLRGANIAGEFKTIVEGYIANRYAKA